MKLVAAWLRIPFWQRVVAGFALGAIIGAAMGPAADVWFGPLGDLYVTLIKMIAIPLVFFAVINAISSLHGQKSVAALGGRTFFYGSSSPRHWRWAWAWLSARSCSRAPVISV